MTVKQAVLKIQPKAYLAKIDPNSAYRHYPLHPLNCCAPGLAWQFQGDEHFTYLYNNKLLFWAAKSPEIFNSLTQAVTCMMAQWGFNTIVYLDNFLIIGDSRHECKLAYNELINLVNMLDDREQTMRTAWIAQRYIIKASNHKARFAKPCRQVEFCGEGGLWEAGHSWEVSSMLWRHITTLPIPPYQTITCWFIVVGELPECL